VSWSLKFDEPIARAKGKALRTLCEAGEHLAALPKKEAAQPHWQLAAQCLLGSRKSGNLFRGPGGPHSKRRKQKTPDLRPEVFI
jgi:hypothetical protein